jgi:hypothetical protein
MIATVPQDRIRQIFKILGDCFMPRKGLKKSIAASAAIAAALAVLPLTTGTALAGDPGCFARPPMTTAGTVYTPSGRTRIRLMYNAESKCAYGDVKGDPYSSHVWVDRQYPYQGMLGGTYLADQHGTGGTEMWNDDGLLMRACGADQKNSTIVCTNWY